MAAHIWAAGNSDPTLHESRQIDPFATPTILPTDLPSIPVPVALVPTHQFRQSQYQPCNYGPSGGTPNEKLGYTWKAESLRSFGGSFVTTPTSHESEHINGAELSQQKQQECSWKRSMTKPAVGRDPEKCGRAAPLYFNNRVRRAASDTFSYLDDDDQDMEDARQLQERKAGKILLFLCGPCLALSALNALWTFVSLAMTFMAQPVRLCARRPTFGQQLGGFLGPSLNLQLKRIYTPLPPYADEDMSYKPGTLVAVQLLSPFLSLGMMLAALVVAVFWFASAVVGDPSGTDKRDDGRETVLALRNWWERWLMRGIRED